MKKRANTGLGLAIIAGVLSSVIAVSAQESRPRRRQLASLLLRRSRWS